MAPISINGRYPIGGMSYAGVYVEYINIDHESVCIYLKSQSRPEFEQEIRIHMDVLAGWYADIVENGRA
jgi:hypothetical protein